MPDVAAAGTAARVDAMLARYRPAVVAGLRAAIDGAGVGFATYLRYHFGWEDAAGNPLPAEGAGKMLRPALCLLCCEAAGAAPERALPAAVALELVHNFTLIHDDIEDGSETRHGRPALWGTAGVAQAINAGDGMFVLAQRTLLRLADSGVAHERVLEAARVLDDACVALCDGQQADIIFEQAPTVASARYEAMVGGKTAALLSASAALGAIAADADAATVSAFAACGRLLGMAFQVQDDALGAWGDSAATGKPVGDDIRSRKKAFPVVYALEHLPADRRDRLDALYAQTRLKEDGVAEVLSLLDEAGARDGAANAARAWAEAAVASVRDIPMPGDIRADIEALASFFVHRSS